MLFSWRSGDDEAVTQVLAQLPAGVATAHPELRAITVNFDGLAAEEVNVYLQAMSQSGVILGGPPSEEAVIRLDETRHRATPSWAAYPDEDGTWPAHCEHCGWSFTAENESVLDQRQAEHDERVHGVPPER